MFSPRNLMNKLDRLMMAITFAEAGEPDIALEIMKEKQKRKDRKTLRFEKVERRPELRV